MGTAFPYGFNIDMINQRRKQSTVGVECFHIRIAETVRINTKSGYSLTLPALRDPEALLLSGTQLIRIIFRVKSQKHLVCHSICRAIPVFGGSDNGIFHRLRFRLWCWAFGAFCVIRLDRIAHRPAGYLPKAEYNAKRGRTAGSSPGAQPLYRNKSVYKIAMVARREWARLRRCAAPRRPPCSRDGSCGRGT